MVNKENNKKIDELHISTDLESLLVEWVVDALKIKDYKSALYWIEDLVRLKIKKRKC